MRWKNGWRASEEYLLHGRLGIDGRIHMQAQLLRLGGNQCTPPAQKRKGYFGAAVAPLNCMPRLMT